MEKFSIKDVGVKVGLEIHQQLIPKHVQEKNYSFPCVIGETQNELIIILDKIKLSDWAKSKNAKELKEYFIKVIF